MKSSLAAVQKDVGNYIAELEQRIAQLEQSAVRAESDSAQPSALSGVVNAQKQIEEIRQAANMWMSGDLEHEVRDLESQLTDFSARIVPEAIEPLSKTVTEWKAKFNDLMNDTAKQYQSLRHALDLDLTELEKSAKLFATHKRSLAKLSRDIAAIPLNCQALSVELQDMVDTHEREFTGALSALTQQLQMDMMRAKVTANSTLSLSLSGAQDSSLQAFLSGLQADVAGQCAHMEESVRDVQAMLEAAEAQWAADVARLQEEIKGEVGFARQQRRSEADLRRRLADARARMAETAALAAQLFP